METETPAGRRGVSSWLLAALAIAAIALIASRMWPNSSAMTPAVPYNQGRPGAPGAAPPDPSELNVRLEELDATRPGLGEVERNPFRFKPKPPPPRPAPPRPPVEQIPEPVGPPPPPPPPPIDLRLVGLFDSPATGRIAAFSDCKGFTGQAREGEILDGRYRIVKIGVESVVVEHANGTGRRTIPVNGCPAKN
jgi:hypothetical protein